MCLKLCAKLKSSISAGGAPRFSPTLIAASIDALRQVRQTTVHDNIVKERYG
jgi:hypothetical protein